MNEIEHRQFEDARECRRLAYFVVTLVFLLGSSIVAACWDYYRYEHSWCREHGVWRNEGK